MTILPISRFFNPANARTRRTRLSIAGMMFLKFLNTGVSLVAVPLYLAYLTQTDYGIWLTISSVVNWIAIFDLGLGNGLRNRFAESTAIGDVESARIYVSTAYAAITVIAGFLLLLFFFIYPFVSWENVFNLPPNSHVDINSLVLIVFSFFCLQFVVQLIKMVVIADQRPVLGQIINTLGSVLALLVIWILLYVSPGNLINLAWSVCGINFLVPVLFSLWLYSTKYRQYRPSIKLIDRSKARDLLSLGSKFFILQGAAIVVFMTDNVIISHVSGPEDVPAYNIAYRYFGFMLVFFNLFTAPYWSAFTEAFVKKDLIWIRKNTKQVMQVWGGVVLAVFLMWLFSYPVYSLWVGEEIIIPEKLNFLMALWVVLSSSVSIYGNFMSGVGKVKLSVYHAIFVMVINIPLSIWLATDCGMGSAGVILASILGLIPRMVLLPIQYFKIISGKAKGIWNQ